MNGDIANLEWNAKSCLYDAKMHDDVAHKAINAFRIVGYTWKRLQNCMYIHGWIREEKLGENKSFPFIKMDFLVKKKLQMQILNYSTWKCAPL